MVERLSLLPNKSNWKPTVANSTMADRMDIDSGYESRARDASPRRDGGNRDHDYHRDRSPRRGASYGGRRDNYNSREPRLEDMKDSAGAPGSRDTDRNFNNSIFVGNLGYDVDSQALRQYFGGAGRIIRADVVTQGGRHRGMATVEFSNHDEVDRAISQFHQTDFNGRTIFVRQDNPPPASRGGDRFADRGDRGGRFNDRGGYSGDRGGYGGERGGYGRDRFGDRGGDRGRFGDRPPRTEGPISGPFYEVFVGNLPFRIHWGELKDLFRECGNVLRVMIKEDQYTGRSRGFGFVYFEKHEDALAAIERFNGYELQGRRIDVREGKKSSDGTNTGGSYGTSSPAPTLTNSAFTEGVQANGPESDTIYVGNMPFATSNNDLRDLFGTIGPVKEAEITYADGRPAGASVVQFETPELAAECIQRLNNYEYGGRNLQISYALRP